MIYLPDFVKDKLISLNRFIWILERYGIITYQDLIKWRGPLFRKIILFGQKGQDRIGETILRNEPLMVSRLGTTELLCLRYYLEKRVKKGRTYSLRVRSHISELSGFFPVDDASIDAFSQLYLDQLKQADVMGVIFNKFEDVVCNNYCPNAELVELDCLAPFLYQNPWSGKLSGKKVLVIHPFIESINRQYAEKRRMLFASPDVLPDFELKTIKAVQSIANSKVGFATWFDAYRHMCDEMACVDFDICLIGAGAYGLPLASFAKSMGKQAIHMGGITQVLFGIRGRRWETQPDDSIAKLFNEHWVRPLRSETPEDKDKVENGCYW
jgi:hypothetical protein